MVTQSSVGFDATTLLGQRSGVGNYTSHLIGALLKVNPAWKYLLFSNKPLDALENKLSGATRVNAYFPYSRWFWLQMKLPGIVNQNQPSLCHFTNAGAPLLLNCPFVLSIHDASLFLYSRLHPRTRLLTVRLLLPMAARRAGAIITMSQSAKKDLTRVLKEPADKINVIYESAPDNFGPVKDDNLLSSLRRKYNLPDRDVFLLGQYYSSFSSVP